MPLYNQPNLSAGIDDAITSTAREVSAFPIMILTFVFFTVLIGGSAMQKKRIGNADYPFWMVLASLTIFFLSLIFTLGTGVIDLATLGIVVAVTIFSGTWFFLSKVRGEQ